MKSRLITALAASAAMALVPSLALAQRQAPPTPEQRIDRLERQVQQMQRQVFPKGRPADTAGFSDDPAATQSSVVTLDQRNSGDTSGDRSRVVGYGSWAFLESAKERAASRA